MVRKNLLKELMETPNVSAPPARLETRTARGPVGGAIGAVSQGIADLRARAVIEIDPHLIRAGGLTDRLEHDEQDHAKLIEQIHAHGQQVPVLVRPDPEEKDAYQIVYGRRRVLACRDLGIAVKALVRDLDDRDLIVAQGQENTARRDLSFIEKANFARQMVEQGFKRKIICAALSIDKTEVSRMLSIVERIPESTILAIGPAPAAGRPRWQKLADLMEETATTEGEAAVQIHGETSDARFDVLLRALAQPEDRRTEVVKRAENWGVPLIAGEAVIGRVDESPDELIIMLEDTDGFGSWLVDTLPKLYDAWSEAGDPKVLSLAKAASRKHRPDQG